MTSIKNIKNKLIETLKSLNLSYGVFQQGSVDYRYIESGKPSSFATFFNNETYHTDYYDNLHNVTVWDFSLNIYATDPEVLSNIIERLKRLDSDYFKVDAYGYDILTENSDYIGRGFNILMIEKEIKDGDNS